MKDFSKRFSLALKNMGVVVVEYPAAVAFGFFFAVYTAITGLTAPDSYSSAIQVALLLGVITNILMPIVSFRFGIKDIWNLAFAGIGIAMPFGAFLYLYTINSPETYGLIHARIFVFILLEALASVFLLVYKREDCNIGKIARYVLKNAIIGTGFGIIVCSAIMLILVILRFTLWRGALGHCSVALTAGVLALFLFILNAVSELTDKRDGSEILDAHMLNRTVAVLFIPLMAIWFSATAFWFIKSIWWNGIAGAYDIFLHIFPVCCTGYILAMLTYELEDNILFRIYRNVYTVLGIPLIVFGGWKFIELSLEYGLTGRRYFALLGFLLLIIGQLFMVFNPRHSGVPLLVTVAVLSVVSVFPAVHYENVAAYSQIARAERIMNSNNMLHNNEITAPKSISQSDRLELSRAIEYLCENNKELMANWLPVNFDFYKDYESVFKVLGEYDSSGNSTLVNQILVGELASPYYSVAEYDIILTNFASYNLYNFSMDNIIGNKGTYSVKFTDYENENITIATVTKDGYTILESEITDELGALANKVYAGAKDNNEIVYFPVEEMSIILNSDKVTVKVVLKSVTVDKRAAASNGRITGALTDSILINEK